MTASQALLDEAVRLQADAVVIMVTSGKASLRLFAGMKRRDLKTLLANDINLYGGWHLPLDAHPELGNNAQLAALLGITVRREGIEPLVPWGELSQCRCRGWNWPHGLKRVWGMAMVRRYRAGKLLQRVARCTGGGRSFIDSAARFGVDNSLPARCLNRPFIPRANRGCIFMPPGACH